MKTFDAIVVGMGAREHSALCHLAARKFNFLGIEANQIGHSIGSSHGESRLIRMAYFENPIYVPLLKRAYDIWDEIDQQSSSLCFDRQRLVIAGDEFSSGILDGIRASVEEHQLEVENLDSSKIEKQVPYLKTPNQYVGIYEKMRAI